MDMKATVLAFFTFVSLAVETAEMPTKILIFQAYVESGELQPNLIVAQRYTGSCWVHSANNPGRSDAWRCQASDMILDPCFEDGTGLACVVSPWSHKTAVLELNTPLYGKTNLKKVNTHAAPWAIELQDGKHCTLLPVNSGMINNQRVKYSCDGYRYNIIGEVDRSSPIWKANLYDYSHHRINKVTVVTAWF